jgi:hypothetical protein
MWEGPVSMLTAPIPMAGLSGGFHAPCSRRRQNLRYSPICMAKNTAIPSMDDMRPFQLEGARGRTRMVLPVSAQGKAEIQMLDEHGKVSESITP